VDEVEEVKEWWFATESLRAEALSYRPELQLWATA
jgi:hypothetical protein